MPEEWVECPICGRELENVGTGLLCEEHGEFNYNFRCPLCGSLVQNLVSTPTLCRCPNPTCENNTALFAAVNNPGLDFARRQFLKSGGQGKDRKIAREILRGDVSKTHNGKEIGNFGGIAKKRYFDDHDIDRIFAVWDEIRSPNIDSETLEKIRQHGLAVRVGSGHADTSEADELRRRAGQMKDEGRFSRFIPRSRGGRPLPAVMEKPRPEPKGRDGFVPKSRGDPNRRVGADTFMPSEMNFCPLCQRYGRGLFPLTKSGLGDKLLCDNDKCRNEFVFDTAKQMWKVNPKKYKVVEDNYKEEDAQNKSKEIREEKNPLKTGMKLPKWMGKRITQKKDGTDRVVLKGTDVAGNIRRNTTKAAGIGILEIIGIIIGAIYGWPFLVAATCWAMRSVLPDGKGYEMRKDFEDYRFGSLFATRQNRYSTGLGAMKSILKVSALLFAGIGMFGTELPFRGFMLLAFFFIAYFSLPSEYNPSTEPYKFLEGIGKPVIAFILALAVFWGIFQSKELMWMCFAFFMIFPMATEKESVARAIGTAGSGISAAYENLDKVIFIVFMILGYIAVMGGEGLNFNFFEGTQATVFIIFWLIAGVGGLMSPATARPYTGVIMLSMVFIFYSTGAGEQVVGQGFFGAWWPTIHNTVVSITTPFAEAFGTIGGTFGSTFKLLTNPTGFAKDIMEGSYEENPTGVTGAYGVEIKDLVVPAIQPGTLSMVTFTLKNEGPADASDVKVGFGLPSYLEGAIAVGHGGDVGSDGSIQNGKSYYSKDMDSEFKEDFKTFKTGYTLPLLFMIDARDCVLINQLHSTLSRLSKRNEYVRLNVSVEYEYEVSSWIPVEIISTQEWQDRTAKGTFAPIKVGSHVSTSPAKLSIGTFDQPIIAGKRPFYVGLNMTSEDGADSEIVWDDSRTVISLELPSEIADSSFQCTPYGAKTEEPAPTSSVTVTWTGTQMKRGTIYCTSLTPADMEEPSKTFFVRAKATFRFKKWVSKDTMFSFGDVCFPQGPTGECTTLSEADCGMRADCKWGTVDGVSICAPVSAS